MRDAEQPQDVVAHINFPPLIALLGCSGTVMMVIVPTLAHGQECQQPVVLAFPDVIVNVAAANHFLLGPKELDVRQRIDAERSVIQQDCRSEEADDQHAQAAPVKGGYAQSNRTEHPQLEQPLELRIRLDPVIHELVLHLAFRQVVELAAEDPTDMRPVKALVRIMRIIVTIRHFVMDAVPECPPSGRLLCTCRGAGGHEELEPTRHLVALMREVSMKNSCHKEHPDEVKGNAHSPDFPGMSDKEQSADSNHMNQVERNGLQMVRLFVIGQAVPGKL